MRICIYCGAYNGTVKKKLGESLKIIHDKYAVDKNQEIDDLISQFEHSCTINPEIERVLKDTQEDMDPMKVFQIFSKIRDDDIPLFHMEASMCKPVDLLLTRIPVPPVCIRPSVAVSSTVKNEDDLTVQLTSMVYLNNQIQASIDKSLPTKDLLENWYKLQWTIALYLNSEVPNLPLLMKKDKPSRGLS